MSELLESLLAWVNAHPGWALVLVCVISLLDAIFIVGALVPAAPVLFGAGALVALGSLELWPAVLAAALGGLVGDGVSYWLGRRYRNELFQHPLLRRYPEAVANSQRFFDRHGGKGVMLARFLGPMRAITPAVAGAAGMKVSFFIAVDSVAALGWALAYILPGMVFGASLGLAAEVAGRLALLMLSLLIFGWLAIWLTLAINRQLQKHAEAWLGAMLDWSRRHRRLKVFGAALADRDQPETPVLAAVAMLLLTAGAAALFAVWGLNEGHAPPGSDLAVYQSLLSVREPAGLWLAVHAAMLGEWPVYLPYFCAVLALLLVFRRRRAAAHWIAALLFGGAITLGLGLVPQVTTPLEYRGLATHTYFPHDLVMAVVIYGFTPVLFGRGRRLYYALTALLLSAIIFARLYLGSLWLSVVLIALVCGILWVAALGLGYHRHLRGERPDQRLLLPALLVLLVASGWHWRGAEARADWHAPAPQISTLAAQSWWLDEWESLPGRRLDMAGRDKQYLNIQWAGDLARIDTLLRARGWQPPQSLGLASTLLWLSPEARIGELPLLPRYHAGRHQVLSLRRDIDDGRQYLLRLWPTEYRLDSGAPLWIGTLVVQEARTVARLFRYPINCDLFTAALDALELPLPGYDARSAQRSAASYVTLLLRPDPDAAAETGDNAGLESSAADRPDS
jgi:membrane protein DedA with SNARE-associated domain